MQIVVAGAGTMGRHIAELLQQEQHDVSLIELDRQNLLEVEEVMDIKTIQGSANNPEILRSAGVPEAQLFLGMTNSDETNLIASMTAHELGTRKTVARVRQPFYTRPEGVAYQEKLGIDMLISPEWMTALELVKHINQPGAIAMESFAGNRLHMRQLRMEGGHPFEGSTLSDANVPPGLLIAMVAREDELIIPRGDTRLLEGDRITFLGQPESVDAFAKTFADEAAEQPIKKIFITGGGLKGYLVARMLERQGYSISLLERDRSRCDKLSRRLEKTRIVWGDATRVDVLKEERVARSDLFMACTGDDEDNLMSCLQAKSLGVPRLFTIMNRPDYARVVEQLGIDLAVSPRHVVGNMVMKLLKRGQIRHVYLIENGRAEVVEFVALPDSPAVGKPLRLLRVPRGCLIAGVLKNARAVVPRGDTVINPGDTVVTLSLAQHFDELERLFGLGMGS